MPETKRVFVFVQLILTITAQNIVNLEFGDNCPQNYSSSYERCAPWKRLVCLDGVCACNKRYVNVTFDVGSNLCIVPLGSDCRFIACGLNAYCKAEYYPMPTTCQCNPNTNPTEDGYSCASARGRDEPCEKDSQCYLKSVLSCVSGKCNCPHSFQNYYDSQSNICRVRVGATCKPGNPLTCDTEAECVPIPFPGLERMSRCECNSEYPIPLPEIQTDPGVSSIGTPGYSPCLNVIQKPGQLCDLIQPLRNICDARIQLVCSNGTCDCMPGLKWDTLNFVCAARDEDSCFIPTNENKDHHLGGVSDTATRAVHCMAGLQCVILERSDLGNKGICARI